MDVENFDSWSSVFNSAAAQNARKEVGLITEAHKNLDNPNNVVVIGTAPSKEAFLAFITSPAQAERMKSAGVKSQPSVTFLEN